MTYISIQAELIKLIDGGALKIVEPLFDGPHERLIFAVPELHSEICGPSDDQAFEYRMGLLRRDLDRFSLVAHLTVGHGTDDNCDLKPLDPEKEEVWEFRSRAPRPSYRIFGRFAEPDVLIATNMERRDRLHHKRSREWAVEIGICKAKWKNLFPYCDPHHGEEIHDYISTNVTDLRDIESR